jgi:hypothetical protein
MRTLKEIIAAPLSVVVWVIAYATSHWIVFIGPKGPGDEFIPMCIGGFVGGLGLVLANCIGRPRLLSFPYLIGGGVLGCVAALPFGLWLRSYHFDQELQRNALQYSFAIWQAAVGTYLYIICTRVKKIPSETSH